MFAPGAEILWTSSKNDTSNDSEQAYGEVSPSLVIGIAGSVCAPIIFALIAVVVCAFRAFKTTFQRLILYHILIVLLCECSFVLQIRIRIDSPHPSPRWLCVIAIYLYLYCTFSWYVYTAAVTNYLFLLTLRLLRGNPNTWQHGKFAECFCIGLSLTLPAAYMWIPIRDRSYQAWHCDKLSSTQWDKDAIILNIATLVLCLEVLVISIILCGLFCYLRRVYKARRQRLTTLLKHFIYHTGICSVVVGLEILWSTYFLYQCYYRYPLSVLSAITHTIDAVVAPLVLLISAVFQTLLSIRHQNGQYCQNICKLCCKSRHKAIPPQERSYMDTERNENQTNPPSNPLNQPSHTYFSVPYTGAFTQVTSDEHYRCIGEHTPLISSGNNDPLQR
ncbi:MAG: hypothetical protein MJE68_21250, partial [Proteobacteria bacterium]|nr:hypothetical protein [Pseudomonadota bacterium]